MGAAEETTRQRHLIAGQIDGAVALVAQEQRGRSGGGVAAAIAEEAVAEESPRGSGAAASVATAIGQPRLRPHSCEAEAAES